MPSDITNSLPAVQENCPVDLFGDLGHVDDGPSLFDAVPPPTPTPTPPRVARMLSFGKRVVDNGFTIVPIQRGAKRPPPRLEKWTERQEPEAIKEYVQRWPNAGIGIHTYNAPAVDIDVVDAPMAKALDGLALAMLGDAPLRVGKAPKRLRAYRCDEPFVKLTTSQFTPPGGALADAGRVEILAKGQQFVASAIHPETGKPYAWPDGRTPLNTRREALTPITAEQARAYVEAANALFLERGWVKVVEAKGKGGGSWGDGTLYRAPVGYPLWVLQEAIDHIKNEADDWDSWTRWALGLFHETRAGAIAEAEARELFFDLSEKHCRYDIDVTEERWRSAKTANGSVGGSVLIEAAEAAGWREPLWMFDELDGSEWSACDDLAEKAKMVKIQWDSANFRHHANSAGRAILRRGWAPAVLGHAGRLVYVTYGQPSVVRDPNGDPLPVMPLIRAYDKPLLRERLTWDCAFEVPKTEPEEKGTKAEGEKKEKKIRWVPAAPPAMVVETLLARGPVGLGGGGHDAPYLAALVEAPTLRPDGTVLDRPGYDSTGIFYFDTGVRFDPVADRPTLADAKRAYAVLRDEVFAEFPFATDLDRDVAVSLLLTALVVRSFGGFIPAFAVMAPIQSSGKTTVVDLVSRLVWGRPAPAMALPESDENVSKALLGILMEGQPCVLFDNVADGAVFKSEEIAKIITSEVYQARELSTHNNPIVACNILLTMTGNNIRLPGDMRSRVLRCRLDPGVESPEKRRFSRDLKEWAAANRGRVVSAILTLLRGWVVAREDGCIVEAEGTRFKTWGRFVRDALVWAGGSDVAGAFATEEEDDDDRTALRCLLDVLAEHPDGLTPGKIIEAHVDADMNNDERIATVLGVVFGGRKPTPHAMGHWLKKKSGQVIGGRKLVNERDTHSKGFRWFART